MRSQLLLSRLPVARVAEGLSPYRLACVLMRRVSAGPLMIDLGVPKRSATCLASCRSSNQQASISLGSPVGMSIAFISDHLMIGVRIGSPIASPLASACLPPSPAEPACQLPLAKRQRNLHQPARRVCAGFCEGWFTSGRSGATQPSWRTRIRGGCGDGTPQVSVALSMEGLGSLGSLPLDVAWKTAAAQPLNVDAGVL